MPDMRLARTLAVSVVIVAALAAPAQAAVVPVDPGPIAAGRPILGTTQNLPPLGSTGTYDAGPGFSDVITAYYESGCGKGGGVGNLALELPRMGPSKNRI